VDVGDDAVRSKVDECLAGPAEAMRQQRQVAVVVSAEMVDEQVRSRQDGDEEPEDERHYGAGATIKKKRTANGGHTKSPRMRKAATFRRPSASALAPAASDASSSNFVATRGAS
jgi:hypothetical protein